MSIQNRIDGSRKLLIKDYVRLDVKTETAWFYEVKSLNDKDFYEVMISERGCSCTCEFSSIWGMKEKHLPCQHIMACLAAGMLKVKRKE